MKCLCTLSSPRQTVQVLQGCRKPGVSRCWGKQFGGFLQLNVCITYHPITSCLGICLTEIPTYDHWKTGRGMFLAVVCRKPQMDTIQCFSMAEWIDELWDSSDSGILPVMDKRSPTACHDRHGLTNNEPYVIPFIRSTKYWQNSLRHGKSSNHFYTYHALEYFVFFLGRTRTQQVHKGWVSVGFHDTLFFGLGAAAISCVLVIYALLWVCYTPIHIFFSIKSFSRNLTWEKSNYNKVQIYVYLQGYSL